MDSAMKTSPKTTAVQLAEASAKDLSLADVSIGFGVVAILIFLMP